MKNIIYLLVLIITFTSCGDDPFSKVKSENVEKASVRDNTPSKFPCQYIHLQLFCHSFKSFES